jgi:hypothetical protein
VKQPTDIDRIVASDLSDQDAVSAIVATGQAGRSAALRYVLIGRGRFTGTPVGNEEVPKSVQHWLAPPGRRSTGQEIFDAKTEAEQNEMVGPGAAQMIRDGDITIADLFQRNSISFGDDFIAQKPLKDLTA